MTETKLKKIGQYLTFRLDEEMFSIDVAQVREVLDLTKITKIPGTPSSIMGVISVRERVVPVMNMRTKFGLPEIENTLNTRIIVMEISIDKNLIILGAIADSVHEVTDLEAGQIEEPPRIGNRWRTEFIKGIGKRDDKFIIILDIDKVISSEELEIVESIESLDFTEQEAA